VGENKTIEKRKNNLFLKKNKKSVNLMKNTSLNKFFMTMKTCRIQALSPQLINQIAAGEVVERPASVIKELVENALDAAASTIQITLRQGGHTLIQIEDDGCGMTLAELKMCFQRHTTSKLDHGDLFNINTFGFRGEALAAICSIARVSIVSAVHDAEHAWKLEIEAGELISIQPAPFKPGTTIEVKDLFFATPARLKFLRSAPVEQSHIVHLVEKMALCHPDKSFSLTTDTKKRSFPAVSNHLTRIQSVMGQDFVQNSIVLEAFHEGYELRGYISLPTLNRANASQQFFFVNQRFVKDKVFSMCLRQAFIDLIPKERHPCAVLFLQMPVNDLDVNVHPAKTEVRFRDLIFIRHFLLGYLKKSLFDYGHHAVIKPLHSLDRFNKEKRLENDSSWPDSLNSAEESQQTDRLGSSAYSIGEKKTQSNHLQKILKVTSQQLLPEGEEKQIRFSATATTTAEKDFPEFSEEKTRHQTLLDFPHFSEKKQSYSESKEPQKLDQENLALFSERKTALDLGRPLGQVHQKYIISEGPKGLFIIDPHAAHERILYEKMKQEWGHPAAQKLFFAEKIPFENQSLALFKQHQNQLSSMGIHIEIHEECVEVLSAPALLNQENLSLILKDFLCVLQENAENTAQAADDYWLLLRNRILGNLACRKSVFLGQRLSIDEMSFLLRQIEQTPHSAQCNHGRPVYREISLKELGSLFERS
jgi:DNA mismatch repair protein MutL